MELLIKSGADANKDNKNGNTVLMRAAENGRSECLGLLIKMEADLNIQNLRGDTTLMYATDNGNSECITVLAKSGADVNKHDEKSCTALMLAAEQGYVKCIQLLVTTGADVNKHDKTDCTAAKRGRTRCIKLLLKAGADINKKSEKGYTCLMFAARYGNYKCVRELLRVEAEIKHRNHLGYSALDTYLAFVKDEKCKKKISQLLYEAEEKMCSSYAEVRCIYRKEALEKAPEICLSHTCRGFLRKHLVDVDSHQNLFCQIPLLGLPSSVNEYNTSLKHHVRNT